MHEVAYSSSLTMTHVMMETGDNRNFFRLPDLRSRTALLAPDSSTVGVSRSQADAILTLTSSHLPRHEVLAETNEGSEADLGAWSACSSDDEPSDCLEVYPADLKDKSILSKSVTSVHAPGVAFLHVISTRGTWPPSSRSELQVQIPANTTRPSTYV